MEAIANVQVSPACVTLSLVPLSSSMSAPRPLVPGLAATVYATLYGRSPVGLGYTAGLDADMVSLLQNAAWDATREYFGRSN